MLRGLMLGAMLLAWCGSAWGQVSARTIEYKHESTSLEGTIVADGSLAGKRPGILLVHEEGATSAEARTKAAHLVRQGYVVLCGDLYGKATSVKDIRSAGLGGKDRSIARGRMNAALGVLARQPQVDPKKLGAIGYGVGGTAILELVRSGADLEGVVCLHGELSATSDDAKKIVASVLAIVGTDDPAIPIAQSNAFEDEMRRGGVDGQLIRYAGVGGGFTVQKSGRDLKTGRAYDADADRRSAEAVRAFFAEMFPPTKSAPVAKTAPAAPSGVPEKAIRVLKYVDEHGEAMDGYEGGRTFGNFEKRLPQTDRDGKRIKYREWDVNPLRPGVNRGAERMVTGSDGSAYYTADHYETFKKIR